MARGRAPTARAAAALAALVVLALIGGACGTAEVQSEARPDSGRETGDTAPAETPAPQSQPAEPTGTDSDAGGAPGDTSAPAEPAPTTTEPAAAPPPEPLPATPEPPETTPARGFEPATDDPDTWPTTTEAAAPEPIHPPEPPPASEPPDEAAAAGDEEAAAVTESLPGEPAEWGPAEGTLLTVGGVPHDEVLNVHDVPSGQIIATLDISNPYESQLKVREAPSGEVIASFDSPTGGIVATGRTRRLPDAAWREAVWNEVSVAGLTGWARAAYLAPIGLSDDLTAHLIDVLGERPVADTLIELALIVGETMASDEPPSRVVVVTRPIVFEALGEVTVDVLNIGDDSLLGFRLLVFATPGADDWMSEDPGPFTLRTVERTILCYSHRGVTADGLCG